MRKLLLIAFFCPIAIAISAQQNFVVDRNFGSACGSSIVNVAYPDIYELFKLSNGKYMLIGNTGDAPDRDILFVRYNANGTIDTDFSPNGVKVFSFDVQNDINSIVYANNKFYIAGHQASSSAFRSFQACVSRFDEDANPDLTFNQTGTLVEPVFSNPISSSFYTHVIVQPDNKIVCYGFEQSNINGGSNIVVAKRYNDDGSVDPLFNPGITYSAFLQGTANYNSPGVLEEDGSMRFVYPSTSGVFNITSVKLDSNGDPFSSYGATSNGMNFTSVESVQGGSHHFVESNGKIYGMRQTVGATQDIRAYSIDEAGNLNAAFSEDGVMDLMDFPGSGGSERPSSIHMDSQNRLCYFGSAFFDMDRGAFYRLDDSGNYDIELDGDGSFALGEYPYMSFEAIYFEDDSTIIASFKSSYLLGLIKLKLQSSNVSISVPDDGVLCVGESTEISVEIPSDCYSYAWTLNGEPFGESTPVITVSDAGVYQVVATAGSEASISQSVEITVVPCIGIAEISSNSFRVYPSPAKEYCFISSSSENDQFVMTDLNGKIVKQFKSLALQHMLDIRDIVSGVYFLKNVSTGMTEKLIICRE